MDGGKQQRGAPIGAEAGRLALPPLQEIGADYARQREPEPDRGRLVWLPVVMFRLYAITTT